MSEGIRATLQSARQEEGFDRVENLFLKRMDGYILAD